MLDSVSLWTGLPSDSIACQNLTACLAFLAISFVLLCLARAFRVL